MGARIVMELMTARNHAIRGLARLAAHSDAAQIVSFATRIMLTVNRRAADLGAGAANMNALRPEAAGTWFSELGPMWPGQCLSLKVDKILHHGRSDFQEVLVFESANYGRVLALDGCIQLTDRDEFSYQEMMAHVPLCALPAAAKKVLIVGGGDGGVAREVARHASVTQIDMAEIDAMVPAMSRRYFPAVAAALDDPRLTVHIGDGFQFLQDCAPGTYDAVIVDSSDPVGPAAALFEKRFFEFCARAVRPGGVLCMQGECLWLHLDLIADVAAQCKAIFTGGSIGYAYTTIPTYPSGQIGLMLCQVGGGTPIAWATPARPPPEADKLRYYNAAIHTASFALPEFARRKLTGVVQTA